MSKHTTGPWTLRDAKYAKGIISEMRFVVECNTNIPEIKNTIALVGYKPNGRLIAAAPELLEALKEMVNCHNIDDEDCSCAEVRYAMKIIAKAEGE